MGRQNWRPANLLNPVPAVLITSCDEQIGRYGGRSFSYYVGKLAILIRFYDIHIRCLEVRQQILLKIISYERSICLDLYGITARIHGRFDILECIK